MGNTVDINAAREFSLVDSTSLCVVISSVKHKKDNSMMRIHQSRLTILYH